PAIARALSKVPDERFPTCRELVAALRAAPPAAATRTSAQGHLLAGHQTVSAPPPSAPSSHHSAPLSAPLSAPPPTAEDTPSSQGVTQNIRALDPSVLRVSEQGEKPLAPQELTGPGSLFPALVIGLGQMGLTVLHKIRESLHTTAPL